MSVINIVLISCKILCTWQWKFLTEHFRVRFSEDGYLFNSVTREENTCLCFCWTNTWMGSFPDLPGYLAFLFFPTQIFHVSAKRSPGTLCSYMICCSLKMGSWVNCGAGTWSASLQSMLLYQDWTEFFWSLLKPGWCIKFRIPSHVWILNKQHIFLV